MTREQLEQLAAWAPSKAPAIARADIDLAEILDAQGIPYVVNEVDEVTWLNLDLEGGCPFGDRSGNRGKCGVGQTSDGRLVARCFADPRHSFADFAAKLGIEIPLVTPSGKPCVVTTGRELNEISADCWRHIEATNDPPTLFRFGSALAEVTEGDEVQMQPVDRRRLSYLTDRIVSFRRMDRGEHRATHPPIRVLDDLLAESMPPLPGLKGLVSAPFFTPSGSLVTQHGYDEETQLYYASPPELQELSIPANPSRKQVETAVAFLVEMIVDFPFAEDSDTASALAKILEPFIRPWASFLTPMCVVTAPTRGSGKGKLIDVLSWPFLGAPVPRMILPQSEEEIDKRLIALLLRGQRYVHFDNVASKLRSDALAAFLTGETYQGRILGHNEVRSFANQTSVFVSGNGVEFGGDIGRRCVVIRLDPEMERPEERTGFRHPNIEAWVAENRARLVTSALTVIRAWLAAGAPEGRETLGSFEGWARTMGGIMEFAGLDGFLANRAAIVEDVDTDANAYRTLFQVWWRRHGSRSVTPTEVVHLCEDHFIDLGLSTFSERSAATSMGRALLRLRGRIFGSLRLVEAGVDKRSKARRWRLEPLAEVLEDPAA